MENKEIDTCKLLYNTERVRLYIPEYGRNVQKMVGYLKTIEDREKRNQQARAVIKVMEIINPAVKLQEDYEHKLWDHLHIISDFSLDVDSPYPVPAPESLNEKPMMITEFSCSSVGGDKVKWIEDMFRVLPKYNKIKVGIWWHATDWDGDNLARPYFIDSPTGTLDVFDKYLN